MGEVTLTVARKVIWEQIGKTYPLHTRTQADGSTYIDADAISLAIETALSEAGFLSESATTAVVPIGPD